MNAWTLSVLGAGMVAAFWDLRWRRIPRWLSVPAFAAGLLYHAVSGGFPGALLAGALGLLLGIILFQLGAVGGGDVKWLAALGSLLGLHLWFWSVDFGLLAAALVALAQVAARGRLLFVAADLRAIVQGWRQRGFRPDPEHNVASPDAITAPLGPALAVGLLCTLLRF